jgi:hypothetical protein
MPDQESVASGTGTRPAFTALAKLHCTRGEQQPPYFSPSQRDRSNDVRAIDGIIDENPNVKAVVELHGQPAKVASPEQIVNPHATSHHPGRPTVKDLTCGGDDLVLSIENS